MTWFETMQLVMLAVPALVAIIGTLIVQAGNYRNLQRDVAGLIVAMSEMKGDIAVIRATQQASASGHPQKGVLPQLATDEMPARSARTPAATDALEGRVDDLEEGIIKDLRIHKVDDPPEGDE